MIFITVGTHEQQFNRLLKMVDQLIDKKVIIEDVICQSGYSNYVPHNYNVEKFISYDAMEKYIKKARIVITHGGPSSFIAPLSINKTPIVVPRQKKFNEHVNNHQFEFAAEVAKRMGNIIVANTESELEMAIKNYNVLANSMKLKESSNNEKFNLNLRKEIISLFQK